MTRPSTLPVAGRHTPTRTVLVVGASYAGHRAIQQLVAFLPLNWKVVVLERNTHFNHLYAFPRMSVVPGHEHKIFVPYTKIFQPSEPPAINTGNAILHGKLTSLRPSNGSEGKAALGRGVATYLPLTVQGAESAPEEIRFDYLVYALGSHLPPPINLWSTAAGNREMTSVPKVDASESAKDVSKVYREEVAIPQTRGSKAEGVHWLRETQDRIRQAENVLVIGGGPLGVQYASDIAFTYGSGKSAARWAGQQAGSKPKQVTLLSSSARILPRFLPWMHEEGVRSLNELGVEVITGARADLSTLGDTADRKKRRVKTLDGREIEADVVLFCTGQRPNTGYLTAYGDVIDSKTEMASVTPYLQLTERNNSVDQERLNHIFVVGDAADAFGALNAGHTAFYQAEVAARNVARLVTTEEGKVQPEQSEYQDWLQTPLEAYEPTPHRIKVSVGLNRAINQNNGTHRIMTDIKEDLNAAGQWIKRGLDTSDMTV